MGFFAHPTALVESTAIGEATRIWAFAHVMSGVAVGCDGNIGDHCFLEEGVIVGDRVTIKNGVMLWSGVTLEDDVFVGPGVVFTNDRRPRSPRLSFVHERYADPANWLEPVLVRRGASIGAASVILCGVTIGAYAMVGAASLVAGDVPAYALVRGSPARLCGHVCRCGSPLAFQDMQGVCDACETRYTKAGDTVVKPAS